MEVSAECVHAHKGPKRQTASDKRHDQKCAPWNWNDTFVRAWTQKWLCRCHFSSSLEPPELMCVTLHLRREMTRWGPILWMSFSVRFLSQLQQRSPIAGGGDNRSDWLPSDLGLSKKSRVWVAINHVIKTGERKSNGYRISTRLNVWAMKVCFFALIRNQRSCHGGVTVSTLDCNPEVAGSI